MWIARAGQVGDVGLLVRQPLETAVPQVVAWGQCAPPRTAAHYEEAAGNQSIPFWSAHIAYRLAVSRRILSSAVCRECCVLLAHVQCQLPRNHSPDEPKGYAARKTAVGGELTDLQLLQPVLTLGLLVLARLCFGGSLEEADVEVGAGDGGPLRWLVPGAIMY